jgi:CRP-like cAMP-binding protein
LWVVVEGQLSVHPPSGASRPLGPGSHLGASSMLRERPSRTTLTAQTPCTVLRIDRDALWRLGRARAWLAVDLIERLSRELGSALDLLVDERPDDWPGL